MSRYEFNNININMYTSMDCCNTDFEKITLIDYLNPCTYKQNATYGTRNVENFLIFFVSFNN